ncbi:MAG: hypothetical protein DRK00_09670, partial [Thermoprotei archaeon]
MELVRRRGAVLPFTYIALVIAAVIIVVALAVWLALTGPRGQLPLTPPSSERVSRVWASARGCGFALVNGTPVRAGGPLELNFTEPATLVLEAVPCRCWRFGGWLVNGTPIAGANTTITVAGNTTIKALFERIHYTVYIAANSSQGVLLVNGSQVEAPCTIEAACGSRLYVNA